MILTIHERLKLLEILPLESNYPGMKEVIRGHNLLNLTDEEAKELKVTFKGNEITWNVEKALTMDKDIPFGEWLTETVRDILYQMHKDYKITVDLMSIYQKFCLDYE
jgi:hypothetical protein